MARSQTPAGAAALAGHTDEVVSLWRELVRWDPAVPTGTTPAVATAVVTAVMQALGRPQPLGWGTDPEVEKVIDVFATASGPIEVAMGHLVCLREAVHRVLGDLRPELGDDAPRLEAAANMILDRALAYAATIGTARLRDVTLADENTRLLNGRSLARDLAREISRAERHGRRVTVVVFDRAVVAPEGPAADLDLPPDESVQRSRLQELARAVEAAIRAGDCAYVDDGRIVAVLSDATSEVVPALVARVAQLGPRNLLWGAASYPDDVDVDEAGGVALLACAVERCVRQLP